MPHEFNRVRAVNTLFSETDRVGRFLPSRRRGSVAGIGIAFLIILTLVFGAYLFIEKWGSSRELRAIDAEGDQGAVNTPGSSLPDPGKIGGYVKENGLEGQFWILIRKDLFELSTWKGSQHLSSYSVAIGENSGNKEKGGDRRTPEGVFKVERTHDSRAWVHDFGDGKGPVEGAYGPYFIRLVTGWKGIGIHGTHDPSSLGTMVTEGCIRMSNDGLLEVVDLAIPGTVVVIEP
jgi:hypothetical protein